MARATIYQRRYPGDSLPRAIKFGNGPVRYRESDVVAWLEAQSDQPQPAA